MYATHANTFRQTCAKIHHHLLNFNFEKSTKFDKMLSRRYIHLSMIIKMYILLQKLKGRSIDTNTSHNVNRSIALINNYVLAELYLIRFQHPRDYIIIYYQNQLTLVPPLAERMVSGKEEEAYTLPF